MLPDLASDSGTCLARPATPPATGPVKPATMEMTNAAPLILSIAATLLLVATLPCTRGSSPAADGSNDDGGTPVDPRAAVCAAADAAPAAVTYRQIEQIFDANCTTCHASGAALDLRDEVSWANVVGQPAPAPESCGGILVTPHDPNDSYLYQKLASAAPCYGSQMPLGEFFAIPLPTCVVAMVKLWIVEGAPGSATDGGKG